jgi:hypothetical protein
MIENVVSIAFDPFREVARPAAPERADPACERRSVGPDELDVKAAARKAQVAGHRPELAAVAVDESRDYR